MTLVLALTMTGLATYVCYLIVTAALRRDPGLYHTLRSRRTAGPADPPPLPR